MKNLNSQRTVQTVSRTIVHPMKPKLTGFVFELQIVRVTNMSNLIWMKNDHSVTNCRICISKIGRFWSCPKNVPVKQEKMWMEIVKTCQIHSTTECSRRGIKSIQDVEIVNHSWDAEIVCKTESAKDVQRVENVQIIIKVKPSLN